MTAGEVFRTTHLIIEPVTAKTGEAIEKGSLVCTDNDGFTGATNALAATSAVYVAHESVKSDSFVRKFRVVMAGAVYAKKNPGAIKQGQKLSVGTNNACKVAASGEIVFAVAAYDAEDTDEEVAIRF